MVFHILTQLLIFVDILLVVFAYYCHIGIVMQNFHYQDSIIFITSCHVRLDTATTGGIYKIISIIYRPQN